MKKLISMMLLGGALAACGSTPSPSVDAGTQNPPPGNQDAGETPSDGGVDGGPEFEDRRYVSDSILLPASDVLSSRFAFDLDGDMRLDNQLGEALTQLADQGFEAQSTVDEAVQSGAIVQLHKLYSLGLGNSDPATWTVYRGSVTGGGAPDFGTADDFDVTTDSASEALEGQLESATFVGEAESGQVDLVFFPGQAPFAVELKALKLEAKMGAMGCEEGRIGGGVLVSEMENVVTPALAAAMTQYIADDPGCPADCGYDTQLLLFTFDSNDDFTISPQELQSNGTYQVLTTPDVDLLDETGAFNPGVDGVNDAVSIGYGFTCVAANFSE